MSRLVHDISSMTYYYIDIWNRATRNGISYSIMRLFLEWDVDYFNFLLKSAWLMQHQLFRQWRTVTEWNRNRDMRKFVEDLWSFVNNVLHILGFFKLWKIWEILWGQIGQVFVESFGWVGCDSDKFALKAFPFII